MNDENLMKDLNNILEERNQNNNEEESESDNEG